MGTRLLSFVIVAFVLLSSSSCKDSKNNENIVFILPNGEVFENPNVKSFQEKYTLKFEPYIGLTFNYRIDSTNVKMVLYTTNTEDKMNSRNLYNNDGKSFNDVYAKIKDNKISQIGYHTFIPKSKSFWDSLLLPKYQMLLECPINEDEKEDGMYEYFCGNELLLTVKYKDENKTLLDMRMLPIKKH